MKLNIALLPGDGIGPEIMTQGLNVTKAICEKFGHELTYKEGVVGARAIDEMAIPTRQRHIRSVCRVMRCCSGRSGIPSMTTILMPRYVQSRDYCA